MTKKPLPDSRVAAIILRVLAKRRAARELSEGYRHTPTPIRGFKAFGSARRLTARS